jgi:host factor-I protein
VTEVPNKDSIQDDFLKALIAHHTPARVLLANGKDLRGIIKACDAFTLIIDIGGADLLVYKSAVSVIGPQGRATE